MPRNLKTPIVCTFALATAVSVPVLMASATLANTQSQSSAPSSSEMNSGENVSEDDEMLDTPDITSDAAIKPPPPVLASPTADGEAQVEEAQVVQTAEANRLKSLAQAAYTTPTQSDLGTSAAADVPSLMAPFREVSNFSLGHTLPGSKWRLFPHFSLSGVFDDNVYLTSNHKVSDFYFALSPGIGAQYGTDDSSLTIRADYTASFLLFMKETSQDTADQDASAHVIYALPKLTLGLNLDFQTLNGANVDVGDRVRRQVYYAGVTSRYQMDEKFSLDVNVDGTVDNYKGYLDSNETRLQTWLNYQATGKTNVGVGVTVGYLGVQDSSDQTYEQLLARVNYDATGKLVLYANGGAELRQSDTETVSPVFAIGAAYSPTATTTIAFDIHERIYGSAALEGQDYRAIGGVISVTQQLRYDLSAIIAVGYENTDYFAVKDDVDADRMDHYVYTRVGPDWQVRPWWHLGAFYEFSRNASSGNGSDSFTRNRVCIQSNFAF